MDGSPLLESSVPQHQFRSWFVTLTYAPEHYPPDGSLKPGDVQLFLKRLRYFADGDRIRYFAVGEYGDRTGRAHYHLVVYGLTDPNLVKRAWSLGHVLVAEFNEKTATYVCGYTLKKMTKPDDPRLQGRHPEFTRMSLKPGIGAGAAMELARSGSSSWGITLLSKNGKGVKEFRVQGRRWPVGRYLEGKIFAASGHSWDRCAVVRDSITAEKFIPIEDFEGARQAAANKAAFLQRQKRLKGQI